MTAVGPVRLDRSHATCGACGLSCFPADRLLGMGDWLTPRALEMACLAGVHDPFRKAGALLEALAGWSVSEDTLRRRSHEHAARASEARPARRALPEAFAAAPGEHELHVDAGKVFATDNQWHDVKVAVLLRREPGGPPDSERFGGRDLPAPAVRSVVAAAEGREAFGVRVEAEAVRLGVPLSAGLSVLGDGADWVWTIAGDHFHGAEQVLDYWHAAEHLASAGRAAFGDGPGLGPWLDGAKRLLAADGYAGACLALCGPPEDEAARARMDGACPAELNYFAGHAGRMGYALRLRRGQAVGSGAVEGAIKQLVNLRVKRTAARWRLEHVGPLVEMLAMAGGPEWREYWASLAS